MNAAIATTTAISQGLTCGRQGSATDTGDNSIGGSLSAIFAGSDVGRRQWKEEPYPRLHVPNVITVLIEGDQPVFTDLKSSPEARGRNCGGGTAAFNVFRMEISEVRVM